MTLLVGCATAPTSRTAPPAAPPSVADPGFVEQYTATYRFRLGSPRAIEIVPGGDAILFLRSGPRSFVHDLWRFDPATGTEDVFLTAADLLAGQQETLTAEERARRERLRQTSRGIASYEISKDGAQLLVPLSGRLFVVDRATRAVRELDSQAGPALDPHLSPDGTRVAAVRDGNLHVTTIDSGKERTVSACQKVEVTCGLAEFVAQEEMGRMRGHWWSPDSTRLVYQRTDTSKMERMHLVDPTHPETAPDVWPYPRPGGVNADVSLGIVAARGGRTTWITWDRETYPYLAAVRWDEGAPLTLLVQNRAQTEEVLLAVDPTRGTTRSLHVERDAAWLNLDGGLPRWLPDGAGYLWSTEREGAWQLERRGAKGHPALALTSPEFGYRHLLHIDAKRGVAHVAASTDPTQDHVWRVPLDPASGPPTALTQGVGSHGAVFGEDADLWVHVTTNLSGERRWRVRHGEAAPLGELTSVAEAPPFAPNVTLTQVEAEGRSLHAALIRPRNFDPARRYPVLLHVYGGPHGRMVSHQGRRYLLDQWMADHGAIVVCLDGRGTPNRGRAWERVVKGNLIDIPLGDQVAGLQALGAAHPELDLDRVGILGWSFGGYLSAMAVMRRPDVFKVGVAGAPVTDWRDYDTHYTERYMGLPDENEAGYDASSTLTYAKDLLRPLLVLHGTTDDNVYFLHALKLSDALFRAGRDHAFQPLVGFTHMVPDPAVSARLQTRILRFLLEGLGASAP